MTAPNAVAIRDWLNLLYADAPGYLSVVTLPGGNAAFFATTELDRAAQHVARKAALASVYVSCCTLNEPLGPGRRGGVTDTRALVGLWCDLDIAGAGHKWGDEPRRELRLPGDRAEALSILDDFGLPPSAVIDSGHGLYGWWLLTTPIVFDSDADRRDAIALSSALGYTLVELGRRRGLHVDNVSDLARILRVPGTVNRKGTPVPVRLLESHGERRYTPAELRGRCIAPEPSPAPTRSPARPRLDGRDSPAEAFCRVVSWDEILEPAGFTRMYSHGDVGHWRHYAATSPMGTTSATTGANGVPVVVVHSESAAAVTGLPVGGGNRLTKFRTWAILNYDGDESAAARALLDLTRRPA